MATSKKAPAIKSKPKKKITIKHLHEHLLNLGLQATEILSQLSLIIKQNKKIMANTDKALQDIADLKTQFTKIGTETNALLQKIIDLQNTAPADTPQVVLDALADLKVSAQTIDDLVPDVA